jgi:hypothetical protein
MPTTSRTISKYLLTFIDDFTRKTWLYFLSDKSQTLNAFKTFKALVENKDHKIESLKSDRGGKTNPKPLKAIAILMASIGS